MLQALLVLAILGTTWAVAWGGNGTVARLLFMACGIAAAWNYRRTPWLYLTLTFWFWTLTPLIRRVIDYRTGFDSMNIVLATPNLMALFMVRDILTSRALLRLPEAALGAVLLAATAYGLVASFVQGQVLPGAVAAADWIAPLLYYPYLLAHAQRVNEAEPHLRVFVSLNAALTAGYGLCQFWAPSDWDVAWALSSLSLGQGELTSATFRIFGTLNSTGLYAVWLSCLVLLSLHFRTPLTLVVLPAIGLLMLLSNVRSVTIGTLCCIVVGGLIGGRLLRRGLITTMTGIAITAVVVLLLQPEIVDRIVGRFVGSVSDLGADTSAIERTGLILQGPALIDSHPFGIGIGALGRGAVVLNDLDLVSVDFGPLSIYLALGWVAGTIYLVTLFAAVGFAVASAHRSREPAALACAMAALCGLMELPFVNVLGFPSAVMWLCAGLATAYGVRARLPASPPRRAPAEAVRRATSAAGPFMLR